ncbi:MAG TPA: methylated-DNA--[protein]-cysteine S-methyltransferase [Terriglobales bacterium]
MPSPVGPLLLAASERGLQQLMFDRGQSLPARDGEVWTESPAQLELYAVQLSEYFHGSLRDFSCPLDLQGTAFQRACWQALRKIPYGSTRTYGELAHNVGRPTAFRAVGQANHRNPVAIIVPCHRVVGSDGKLTGYGGGLEIKEKLLRLEGVAAQPVLAFAG